MITSPAVCSQHPCMPSPACSSEAQHPYISVTRYDRFSAPVYCVIRYLFTIPVYCVTRYLFSRPVNSALSPLVSPQQQYIPSPAISPQLHILSPAIASAHLYTPSTPFSAQQLYRIPTTNYVTRFRFATPVYFVTHGLLTTPV